MSYLLLAIIIIGVSAQDVLKKSFNNKNIGTTFIFSAVSVLAATVFFILSSGMKLNFNMEILPYSMLFALSYGTATVGTFIAIRAGSLSLTSLVISYSLIIPTFYGLLFLNESAGVFMFIGIALLLLSLLLINLKKGDTKITKKWVLFAILAFIGNGMCSTSQKIQQLAFDGNYKNEFMIIALATVFVTLLVVSLFAEKGKLKASLKAGAVHMILCGAINGLVNLLVMVVSGMMPNSVMFPLISAGGILLTAFLSRFVYHERLSSTQIAGLICGTAAVVFLNF